MRYRAYYIVAVLFLVAFVATFNYGGCLGSGSSGSSYTPPAWATKASMPNPRGGLACGVVNNKIYAIGGIISGTYQSLNQVYDPATNQWEAKTDMPTPRSSLSCAVVNNKIYAIGGVNGSGYLDVVERYDTVLDTWAPVISMPVTRAAMACAVVDDSIYLFNGEDDVYYWSATLIYDTITITGTWTTNGAMDNIKYGSSSSVVVGGVDYICVMGGENVTGTIISTSYLYKPISDTWYAGTPIPGTRAAFASGVVNNLVYAIGGYTSGPLYSRTNYCYNPVTDVWTQKALMPTIRFGHAVGVVNNKIYVIGGVNAAMTYLNTVEEYTPAYD